MYFAPGDRGLASYITEFGVWEPNETKWLVRSVRPGDIVVDICANIGYETTRAAALVGETGRVYAFEPDPLNFEILQRNVEENGWTSLRSTRRAPKRALSPA